MNIHTDDIATFRHLETIAWQVAKKWNVPLKVVEPKRRPHPGGHDGLCYINEGRICFVLRYKIKKEWYARPLPYKYVRDVVGHELAHLMPGCHNHADEFKKWERIFINELREYDANDVW